MLYVRRKKKQQKHHEIFIFFNQHYKQIAYVIHFDCNLDQKSHQNSY